MAATAIRTVMLSLALAMHRRKRARLRRDAALQGRPPARRRHRQHRLRATSIADYDTDSKKFTWSGSYKGVATYATSASFHGAPDGPRRGFVRIQTIDSPFEGSAILSDKQGEGLLAGEWSIVIRTAGSPKGELRGQLVRGN